MHFKKVLLSFDFGFSSNAFEFDFEITFEAEVSAFTESTLVETN